MREREHNGFLRDSVGNLEMIKINTYILHLHMNDIVFVGNDLDRHIQQDDKLQTSQLTYHKIRTSAIFVVKSLFTSSKNLV